MVPKYAVHIENTVKIKRSSNKTEYRSCNNIHPSLFVFKSDFINIQEYYYAVNEYGIHYVGKLVKPLMYSDNFTDVNGIGARNEIIIDTQELLGVEHPAFDVIRLFCGVSKGLMVFPLEGELERDTLKITLTSKIIQPTKTAPASTTADDIAAPGGTGGHGKYVK